MGKLRNFLEELIVIGKPKDGESGPFSGTEEAEIKADFLFIHTFSVCVGLIGNALAACEFQTYRRGEIYRGDEYYRLNIRPNGRQNAPEFWRQLVYRLYQDNEALVVQQWNEGLFVADGYSVRSDGLRGNVYTQVAVGDVTLPGPFRESDVLHLSLGEIQVRKLNLVMAECYRKILEFTVSSYQKARGTRLLVDVEAMAQQSGRNKDTFQENVSKLINRDMARLFKQANAAIPIFKGTKVTELGSKTYSAEGTRDIRAMVEDVTALMCRGFGIPPKLLAGDIAGIQEAERQFMTQCVDPLAAMIQAEVNGKRYTPQSYLEGDRMYINTKAARHIGYNELGQVADRMLASGWSPNEVRRMAGEPEINEPWANEHYVTKNNGLLTGGKERSANGFNQNDNAAGAENTGDL